MGEQRTWVRGPARTWQLTTICNSSFKGSDAIFQLLLATDTHMECSHTCRQSTHTNKNLIMRRRRIMQAGHGSTHCNPRTQEAEVRSLPWIWGQNGQHTTLSQNQKPEQTKYNSMKILVFLDLEKWDYLVDYPIWGMRKVLTIDCRISSKNPNWQARKTALWIKSLVTKPDDLSPISVVKG